MANRAVLLSLSLVSLICFAGAALILFTDPTLSPLNPQQPPQAQIGALLTTISPCVVVLRLIFPNLWNNPRPRFAWYLLLTSAFEFPRAIGPRFYTDVMDLPSSSSLKLMMVILLLSLHFATSSFLVRSRILFAAIFTSMIILQMKNLSMFITWSVFAVASAVNSCLTHSFDLQKMP